jgi:multiple antibiotic resistance protein
MDPFMKSFALLLVLLNPFIMSVYLIDVVRQTDARTFARSLVLGGAGSYAVFVVFALAGDALFTDVLQIRFVSFLIFGGVTFLVIGIRLILFGGSPIPSLRSKSSELPSSIAVPFLIGPGTVSASVLAGTRLAPPDAALAIGLALAAALLAIIGFKWLHDFVHTRNERIVQRYTEIAGRATALFTGSFAVEMILTGLESWMRTLPGSG